MPATNKEPKTMPVTTPPDKPPLSEDSEEFSLASGVFLGFLEPEEGLLFLSGLSG